MCVGTWYLKNFVLKIFEDHSQTEIVQILLIVSKIWRGNHDQNQFYNWVKVNYFVHNFLQELSF